MRPQLEETIRLRREKTRRECANSRRRAILDIARSMVRSNKVKLLLYDELLELPVVAKIISADGFHKTISEGDIQTVKASVLDLGRKRLQGAADFCGVNMMAAFTECGLIPSDVMTSDCDRDKPSRSSSISLGHRQSLLRAIQVQELEIQTTVDFRRTAIGSSSGRFRKALRKIFSRYSGHSDREEIGGSPRPPTLIQWRASFI